MAGIMDMFSGFMGGKQEQVAAPQQQPQQQQSTPGNIPANAGQVDPANNQVPAGGLPDTKVESPLSNFADLWKPAEQKEGQQPNAGGYLGTIDPAKVMEAAKGTDFTKVITPDVMQKITAGGPEAMQAMMTAMNSVTQAAFAQSAITSAKMVEQALSKAETKFAAELPNHVKRFNVSENMRASNPVFSNPAVAPIISAVEFQLTQKYPQASASEITKMAQQYVEDFGNAVIPKQAEQQNQNASKEPDWSSFLA